MYARSKEERTIKSDIRKYLDKLHKNGTSIFLPAYACFVFATKASICNHILHTQMQPNWKMNGPDGREWKKEKGTKEMTRVGNDMWKLRMENYVKAIRKKDEERKKTRTHNASWLLYRSETVARCEKTQPGKKKTHWKTNETILLLYPRTTWFGFIDYMRQQSNWPNLTRNFNKIHDDIPMWISFFSHFLCFSSFLSFRFPFVSLFVCLLYILQLLLQFCQTTYAIVTHPVFIGFLFSFALTIIH